MASKPSTFQKIELMPRDEWNVETTPGRKQGANNEAHSPDEMLGEHFMTMVSEEEDKANKTPWHLRKQRKYMIEHTAVDNMDLSVYQPKKLDRDALLGAVMSAFNNHHPIVFTPDLVYGYLAKGIAIHIEKYPEELRSLLVSHEGKEDLKYTNDSFVRGCKDNDWADMYKNFADQLRERTKENSVVQNDLSFSTSTPMTEAHRHVLCMDSLKSCFGFFGSTSCGISCVILEGTAGDWKLLQETVTSQLAEINKYCEGHPESKSAALDWWTPAVEVMLENFRISYETQESGDELPEDLKLWWSTIYKFNGATGSGEVDTVTGWLNILYPYVGEMDPNPWVMHTSPIIKDKEALCEKLTSFFEEPEIRTHFFIRRPEPDEVELLHYPSYLASVPFTWQYFGEEHKMNILIGYSLLGQVAVEGSLYPRGTLKVFPTWVIYYKEGKDVSMKMKTMI